MERDDQYNNEQYNRRNRSNNQNEELDNFKQRYRSGGNYYGMADQNAEYSNVHRVTGDTYSQGSGGPVGGYGASSYRGSSEGRPYSTHNSDNYNSGSGYFQNQNSNNRQNDSNHYRYGDPNSYMQGQRNTHSGRSGNSGYDYNEDRGYGTAGQHYSGNYQAGGSSGNQSGNRYARQDNSYQMGGQGRHYNEFARDEQRGYNPGNVDMYQDRNDFNYSRSDNDYGHRRNRHGNNSFDGNYDNEDFRYGSSEIHETDRSRQRSQPRSNRPSGPDYSADSAISGFGQSDLRG